MAGTAIEGKNCKVTIGSNTVLGIGDWSYTPGEDDEYDNTEFGDTSEMIVTGITKRGTIEFSGLARIDDNTGQEVLKVAKLSQTQLNDLRLYYNTTKYLGPNSTTGYYNATSSTGNSTQKSYVTIKNYEIKAIKNGLATVRFTATVSGQMVSN